LLNRLRGATKFIFDREFIFRPRWPDGLGHHRIAVRSRDGGFEANIKLRRRSSDLRVFQQIFLDRDYDTTYLERGADIAAMYESIIQKARPLILDLGANIGLASLYFASKWPRARIIAVEPAPDNYQLLQGNIGEHDQILPLQAAVAANAGAVTIANADADAWAYRTQSVTPRLEGAVPAVPVADLLKMEPACVPFIAKIDIEGFEQDLFAANTEWVASFPLIVIELHDWMLPRSGSSQNFLRTIANLDRDFICRGENVFSISNKNAAASFDAHRKGKR
jgi:FkbM family methyltransferase